MFNRGIFNQTAFNQADVSDFLWHAEAFAEANTTLYLVVTRRFALAQAAKSGGQLTFERIYAMQGDIEAVSTGQGRQIRIRCFASKAEALAVASAEGLISYGTEVLELNGIGLQAGDVLMIDTDNMTITKNGENIVALVTDDSIFFKLNPGNNNLQFEGGSLADIKILWKDRWI